MKVYLVYRRDGPSTAYYRPNHGQEWTGTMLEATPFGSREEADGAVLVLVAMHPEWIGAVLVLEVIDNAGKFGKSRIANGA